MGRISNFYSIGLKKRKAPGPFGSFNEHETLVPPASTAALINAYLTRGAPLPPPILRSWGTLLPKPQGGFRPIAVSEPITRVIGRILAARLTTPSLVDFLARFGQLGPARHGAALLSNLAGLTPTCGADIQNAFNTLYRSFLLRAVIALAPDAARLTTLLYLTPSKIDLGSHDLAPLRGVRQGCPAAAPLFALSVAFALSLAPSPPPVLMYADDIVYHQIANPEDAHLATSTALHVAGLTLKPLARDVSTCGGCSHSHPDSADAPLPTRLEKKIPAVIDLLNLVQHAPVPLHVKYNVVRVVPSLFQYYIFATALSHPVIAHNLAARVDDILTNAIENFTDTPVAHPALLGIQTLVPTVSASRIIIARGLEDHLPDPLKLHLRTGQMHKVVLAAFHTMYQQTPAECTFTNLTRIATESALRNTELKLPPLALARWRSLTGDFLQLHRSPISNEHFRSVVNLLANPPEPGEEVSFKCPLCGCNVTDATSHRLCCPHVSAVRMLRHNLITRGALAATWAEATGTTAELEPPTTLAKNTTAKADIALTDVSGRRLLFDVTVTQPESTCALQLRSDRITGAAATAAFRRKTRHYAHANPPVTPLVWEAYGHPHKDTRTALGRIATAAAEFQKVSRDAFLRTLRGRVCAALLLGTARALHHIKTLRILLAARDASHNFSAPRPPPDPSQPSSPPPALAPAPPQASPPATPARRPAPDPSLDANQPPTQRRRTLIPVGEPPPTPTHIPIPPPITPRPQPKTAQRRELRFVGAPAPAPPPVPALFPVLPPPSPTVT